MPEPHTPPPIPEKSADRPDPEAFGRQLATGFGVNLLYADLTRAARFQNAVFAARIVYWDEMFAIMQALGATWLLHADESYGRHPLRGIAMGAETRGAGAELRLYGADPDAAAAQAEAHGGLVLEAPRDKPHGVREGFIADPEGYIWVPTRPLTR